MRIFTLFFMACLLLAVSAETAFASCASPDANTRFLVAGGSGLWSGTNNWSTTSGGSSGASVPDGTKDVCFDSNSGSQNMSLNSANRAALEFNVSSGYTGTLSFGANTLTTGAAVVLGANMGFTGTAGSGILVVSGTNVSMTSNGKAVPNLRFFSATTYTLVDNWTVTGDVTATTTASFAVNTGSLTIGGSITWPTTTGDITGTSTFIMNGTGTLSMSSVTSGSFRNSLTINTSGTITFSGTINYRGGTLTYTAGTIAPGSSTWVFPAAATISATGSPTLFNAVSITGGNQTWQGASGFSMASLSQLVAGGSHTMATGNTYTVTSSLILTATSASHVAFSGSGGTASLNFSGSIVALVYANFTDVLASGAALQTYQGALSGTATGITQTTTIPTGTSGGRCIGC